MRKYFEEKDLLDVLEPSTVMLQKIRDNFRVQDLYIARCGNDGCYYFVTPADDFNRIGERSEVSFTQEELADLNRDSFTKAHFGKDDYSYISLYRIMGDFSDTPINVFAVCEENMDELVYRELDFIVRMMFLLLGFPSYAQ